MRVLVITNIPSLGCFEPFDIQYKEAGSREEYERVYLDNLKETFGTELVVVPQEKLFEKMQAVDEEKGKEVTKKWIDEAVALRGTNEAEVLKSAKLYLAMKELIDEHNCNAITTEGYTWPKFEKGSFPSQGLPSSQLCTDGVVATSETAVNSLITQQLGLYVIGSTGFHGDCMNCMIDPFHDVVGVCHCEGPFNPYGDERRAPFIIRNLPLEEENTGGACVQINYPVGETVTVTKISMYDKKISVFTGKTVSGEMLFPYWDDILCRTKIAIKTDAKALFENLDWSTFGAHRVAFFGDYRQEIKDLAKLIGFEVVEEDKIKLPDP